MHKGLAEGQGDGDDIQRHQGEHGGENRVELEELDDETGTTQLAASGGAGENTHRGGASSLREMISAGASSMGDQAQEELEMAVGSGAAETVVGAEMSGSVETTGSISKARSPVQHCKHKRCMCACEDSKTG